MREKRIPAALAAELADHVTDDAQTSRRIDVLRLIAAGDSNKIVADRLSITEETVNGHVKSILSKLGAHDRTHAVTIGMKRELSNCAPSKGSVRRSQFFVIRPA